MTDQEPNLNTNIENDGEKTITNDEDARKEKIVNLKNIGNEHFKQENYDEAINYYLNALEYCHISMNNDQDHDENSKNDNSNHGDNDDDRQIMVILYSNLAATKDHQEKFDEAIDYCNQALQLNPRHSKALLRRAQLFHKTDKLDESLNDYNQYLQLNPDDRNIKSIQYELKCKIDERNEKLKNEMLSKLKDLGNVVLKPFGLSTDNFKLTQNPETGGYSVNFQK